MMKILILNCFSRNALAAINSLDSNYTLVGGAVDNKFVFLDSFLKSNKLKKIFRYPNPKIQSDMFKDALISIVKSNAIDIIIPAGTVETDMLSFYKKKIEKETRAKLLVEEFTKLEQLTDKWSIYELASKIGVTAPKTIRVKNLNELEGFVEAGKITIPFIVKPTRSYASKGLEIFKTKEKFDNFLITLKEKQDYDEYVAQEFIDGDIHDSCMLTKQGELVSGLTQVRKMMWANTGSGIINLTTDEPEMIDISLSLTKAVNWNGIVLFEFIKSSKDGKYYLIECNPKIWGTTDLTIKAGHSIVQNAVDSIILDKDVKINGYEKGLLYKWIFPECISSIVLKKPRTFKTVKEEIFSTYTDYNAKRVLNNINKDNFFTLIAEVLNKS